MTLGLAVNLLALIVLGVWLIRHAWPPTEAVRLRNALLVQPASVGDFHWIPETVPNDFRREQRLPGQEFLATVAELGLEGLNDWQKAVRIAGHLAENAQDKGRLQEDPVASYRGIRDGYGYCADFAKVFLALAHAAGLFARQWAFSFDGFGGHGHTIVEVFDRGRGKWLFLDPHNNFHVVDAADGEPLSALEFRDSLLGRRGPVRMQPNGPGRLGYMHEQKAFEYFRRGAAEWYLWWGNAVFSYYAHPLVRAAGRLSRGLAHLVAILVGVQPHIRIYPADECRDAAQRLFALQRSLKVGAVGGLLLLISLVAQLKLGAQA
jgi:hypothetical protein